MIKGGANAVVSYTADYSNITNTNNQVIFNKIVSEKTLTPMFDYLMNFQITRINDVRSLSEYNYGNISLQIAESLSMEEIVDDKTIKLPEEKKVKVLKKATLFSALEKRKSVRNYIDVSIKMEVLSAVLQYRYSKTKSLDKTNICYYNINNIYFT